MNIQHPGSSTHHLFTCPEIRAKLVEVFGHPISDNDHEWLHAEVRRIHRQMPTFDIDTDRHREIHKRRDNRVERSQEWHPIRTVDDMPTEDGMYLVTRRTDSGRIYTFQSAYSDGVWQHWLSETVTAWMPLPEPYKGDSDEQ